MGDEMLSSLSKQELLALCVEERLSPKGSKAELIERLLRLQTELKERVTSGTFQRVAGPAGGNAKRLRGGGATKRDLPPLAVATTPTVMALVDDDNGDDDNFPVSSLLHASMASKSLVSDRDRSRPEPRIARGRGRGRGRGRPRGHISGHGHDVRSGVSPMVHLQPQAHFVDECIDCEIVLATHTKVAGEAPRLEVSSARWASCRRCGGVSGQLLPSGAGNEGRQWCDACRFEAMDPFNICVDGDRGMLAYVPSVMPVIDFSSNLCELFSWRERGLSVEVRMIRRSSDDLAHVWPSSLDFRSNAVDIFSVTPKSDGHKRRDVPVAIESQLVEGVNHITLRASDDCLHDFSFAMLLVRPVSLCELSAQVPRQPWESALLRVRSILEASSERHIDRHADEILCLSSDILLLRCPITMERVEEPVRGEKCSHLRCFSLQAYLLSNRHMSAFNKRWTCPVCSRSLRPSSLLRDGYTEKILEETPVSIEEVNVARDGTPSYEVAAAHSGALSLSREVAAGAVSTDTLDLDSSQSQPVLAQSVVVPASTAYYSQQEGYREDAEGETDQPPRKRRQCVKMEQSEDGMEEPSDESRYHTGEKCASTADIPSKALPMPNSRVIAACP